ncbi:uncharacterized protein LOC110826504 [Zootermopsis nevadensis]|uniref:uncharacterized protein LOC110826504 n=1 Tax=Zootermopsis nevadensis TaxID=136037 RepID=UPI000B8ECB94|nr:uncharacterized protein LOC110826504 [Zootermopsis nevadensis]
MNTEICTFEEIYQILVVLAIERWFVVATLLMVDASNGAKILGIFPFHARSHAFVASALMLELANRGHEVTVISYNPQKEKVANYTEIIVKTTLMDLMKVEGAPINLFQQQSTSIFLKAFLIWRSSQETCDLMLQEEEINKLIHATNLHFDLLIIEAFFNECFLGFVHKFKAPLIHLCTFGGTHWIGDWVGNPNPYSYVPDTFLEYSDKMNFWERAVNTIVGTGWRLGRHYYYLPGQDSIMRKHFNDSAMPSVNEIEYSTSLVLLNHHFSISYPRPLMPNMVQVGGMHVKPPNKIPQELEKFLDDATDGVIYFSMGSNLLSSELPDNKRDAFLKAFSQLKQKVLWKWETETLPGQPDNVRLGKWFPQADILAHRNIRLFMTHGGLLSTQEALNRGVPMVGIPVFGDQTLNMARAKSAGYGVMLSFHNITTESVTWALKEVLENNRYRENAQRLSRIYRDQPLTPLEQAVFWTEYVIRHKGAPHMRSAALDLTWYQYFLLDVIAVLALAAGSALLVMFLIIRALLRIFSGISNVDKSKKKQVNLFLCVGAILLSLQKNTIEGANVLGIFPFHVKSHSITSTALMRELANRGHNVTVLSMHPQNKNVPNYTDVVLKSTVLDLIDNGSNTGFSRQRTGVFGVLNVLFYLNQVVCDRQLQEEGVQKLIHSTDTYFDIVIVEAFFNECFLGFVHKFKAPLIQICTFAGFDYMGHWVGNPNPYSYVPNPILKFNDRMNIWERMINTLVGTFVRLLRNHYYLPGQDAIMRKHFNYSNNLPSVSAIEHTTSLLLINHHFSIGYPKPLMPNIIQIGGMHVKSPKKLPQDVETYLDEAPDGAIYFSFGSNLKSSEMPESTRQAFVDAFSNIKQRILWKWDTDTMLEKPKNVKLGKWFPQSDILAHPNIRLFMTHGGLLSTQEAIDRGVPIMGIPVFGDQQLNVLWTVSKGFGVLLDFSNVTSESVSWALNEVLNNPRYRENAQRVSRIYRDQPLTPLDQAVFWTEYVIRHKGAPHMRSAALDLTWYQYFLLDVIAVLALAGGSVVAILFLALRVIKHKMCGSGRNNNIFVGQEKKDG